MLARLLRLLLLFELFAYLVAAVLLIRFSGWRPVGAALLMVVLALAWRSGIVAVAYGLAFAFRPPNCAPVRIEVRQRLREYTREVAAFAALTVVAAFDRVIPKRDAPSRFTGVQLPILLIHGYCCNRGFWWWLKPRLEARGRSVATLTLEPLFGDIDGYAEQVARRVEALCRETGADQVMLVGHGMGGLASRAYLRRYGEVRVARLVTLGTPHRGSVLARFGLGRNSRQMKLGNPWLRDLELSPLLVPCVACHSTGESLVMPAGAILTGAEQRTLPAVGHLAMSISPLVLAAVLEATG